MSKVIAAVLDRKGNVVEPEHILLENGVRVVDGVEYGRGKAQVREPGARRQTSNTEGDSLTKQSEATINGYHVNDMAAIVQRSMAGGLVMSNSKVPQYIDTVSLPTYEASLNQVAELNGLFSGLDLKLRQRFGNDALKMVDFLTNKDNHVEAVALGLLDKSVLPPAEPLPAAVPAAPGVGA